MGVTISGMMSHQMFLMFLVRHLHAVDRQHKSRIKCLAKARADVNITSRYARTPLQLACEHGQSEVVNFLIELGANVNNTKSYGRTSLQLACEQGHAEIVESLVYAGSPRAVKGENRGCGLQYDQHSVFLLCI